MNDRPHLLIVDDDREIRGLLANISRSTSSAHQVADGREMRRVMERSHVDLLVLDLMLPGRTVSPCVASCAALAGADHHA